MIQTAASALVPNVLPAAVAAEAADGGTKSRKVSAHLKPKPT